MSRPLEVQAGAFALVTGASSGIGASLAHKLAARGVPVLLSARPSERLTALAGELGERFGVEAHAVPADLGVPGAATALWEATEGAGRTVDLLVANAGFGFYGPQVEHGLERTLSMLQVNVVAVTELVHHALLAMRARRRGRILVVSSTAAFLPVPYMSVYAATKVFDLFLAHGLHEEARRDGVTVTALCPGTTRTAFHEAAGLAPGERVRFPSLDPDTVAEAGLRGLARGRPFVVANPLDRLWIATGRLVPRSLPPRIGALVFSRLKRRSPG